MLVGAVVLAALLLPGIARLSTDNSPEIFFVPDSEGMASYETFRERFGSDETLRLAIEGPSLWSRGGLVWIGEIETRAAAIPGVARVTGLAEHYRRFGWPPDDPEALRQRATGNPLDRGAGWVDADGAMVTILVQFEAEADDESRLITALRSLTAEPPGGLTARWLGLPVLNDELDRSSAEIERRFFPLLVLFTVVLLGVCLRCLADMVAPLLFVGLCQLLTLGVMGYAGRELNLVLAVLPPLIFVIALATVLHLLLRFRQAMPSMEEADDERLDRTARVFAEKGWAVLWTGLTTAVGFASLAISPLEPVRALGLWAAWGLLATTFAALVVLPALIAVLGTRRPMAAATFEARLAPRGERWGRWARRHRRGVLTAASLVAVIALAGIPRWRVESNALRYLAPSHPLRAGIEHLEERGIGIAAVELLVTLPTSESGAPPPFGSAIEVDRLGDLGAALEQIDGVFGVVNAGVVLRDALRHIPSTPTNATFRPQMALEGMRADVQGRQVLDALLADDRRTARSTVFVETAGTERLEEIRRRIEDVAAGLFPEGRFESTGEYPLLLEAQRHLLTTLTWSLGLTLLGIGLVLRFLLPSSRLTFLALVPNLWPVIGVFGVMGWFDVPLDIATVMMASVVLGLAVDDTIHTLGHFRKLAPVHGSHEAVALTLHATAPAYLLTGVILMAGFGVCALSDFAPIARFGGLSALAIGLAVICDLFLLPALLSLTPDEVCGRLKT